ncbi:MAG: hypothetical protein FWD47_05475 [Treponema sp.]|nr:hypothetical protein [Treponema sp.]
MSKRILICAGIIFFIAMLGLTAYNFFEIYPSERWIPPSREASSNFYYAMEQWLINTGHTIRKDEFFNTNILDKIDEKVILIEQNYYSYAWIDDYEKLTDWIEQGGFLTIFLYGTNIYNNLDEFTDYLLNYGITLEFFSKIRHEPEKKDEVSRPPYDIYYETENKPDTNLKNEDFKPPYDRIGDFIPKTIIENPFPYFDSNISFSIDDSDFYNSNNIISMKDENGIIRLVEIPIGAGSLTITGRPFFIYNYSIGREPNAVLSWKLTAERTSDENNGILFIRGQYRETRSSLFGPIMERGNLYPVIISVILLIILGFWMVIPMFGLVSEEKQRTSRPIKDRFNAEIRFLKKYNALDYYLDVYKREHKTDDDNNKKEKMYNYGELINKYRSELDGKTKL